VRLYKNTGCQLTLVGYLKLVSGDENNKVIFLERKRLNNNNDETAILEEAEIYSVRVSELDYSRINKFGFSGMLLSVVGDLQEVDQRVEIIAKKIDFLYVPKAGKFSQAVALSDEMVFNVQHISKLKSALGYRSALYFEALHNVH